MGWLLGCLLIVVCGCLLWLTCLFAVGWVSWCLFGLVCVCLVGCLVWCFKLVVGWVFLVAALLGCCDWICCFEFVCTAECLVVVVFWGFACGWVLSFGLGLLGLCLLWFAVLLGGCSLGVCWLLACLLGFTGLVCGLHGMDVY